MRHANHSRVTKQPLSANDATLGLSGTAQSARAAGGPVRPPPHALVHPGRVRRTPLAPLLLPVLLVVLLGTSGCTSSSVSPSASGSASASPTTTSSLVGRYHVRTRTLDLTDPSRTTDPTPGQPGDEVAGRHLPTTVWYPTGGTGPFPVVVFSHGTDSLPAGYEDLLSGWASAGMVVVAPTFPLTNRDVETVFTDVLNQPADVSYVLTQVLALDTTPGDAFEGLLDPAHIAAAGHS